jgi:hypothetical protein
MGRQNKILIKELADAEVMLTLAAKRCYKARKVLERVEGSSPVSRKGKVLTEAQVVHITTARRKRVLKVK